MAKTIDEAVNDFMWMVTVTKVGESTAFQPISTTAVADEEVEEDFDLPYIVEVLAAGPLP